MSTVKKRPGSKYYWYSTGTPPTRIRKSTGMSNIHAARIKQKEFDIKYEQNGLLPSTNVNQFIDHYLIWHKQNKKQSWSDRVEHGLKPFRDQFGGLQVDRIDIEHIQSYKEKRIRDGYAGNTINHELSMLTGMFKYAIMRRMIMSNPADAYFVSRIDTSDKRRQPIDIDVVREIIASETNLKDKAMYTLATYAGMRSGDAGTLTEDNTKDGLLTWNQGKVGRRCVVPIHPLLEQLELSQLYITKSQRRSLTLRLQKRLRTYNIQADFHSLRHTFGHRLEELGLDHLEIKFLMGHRIDDITWRYIHKNVDKFSKVIEKI